MVTRVLLSLLLVVMDRRENCCQRGIELSPKTLAKIFEQLVEKGPDRLAGSYLGFLILGVRLEQVKAAANIGSTVSGPSLTFAVYAAISLGSVSVR